jgi:hypothetical protein
MVLSLNESSPDRRKASERVNRAVPELYQNPIARAVLGSPLSRESGVQIAPPRPSIANPFSCHVRSWGFSRSAIARLPRRANLRPLRTIEHSSAWLGWMAGTGRSPLE